MPAALGLGRGSLRDSGTEGPARARILASRSSASWGAAPPLLDSGRVARRPPSLASALGTWVVRATCGGQVWWSQQTGPRQLQAFPPGLPPSSGCTLPAVAWRDRRSWSHSRWAPAPSLGAVQLSAGSFHLGSLSLPVSPLEPVRPELSARPWACPGAGRSRWGPPQHPDPAVWFVEAGRRVPPSPLIHGNERGVCSAGGAACVAVGLLASL